MYSKNSSVGFVIGISLTLLRRLGVRQPKNASFFAFPIFYILYQQKENRDVKRFSTIHRTSFVLIFQMLDFQ